MSSTYEVEVAQRLKKWVKKQPGGRISAGEGWTQFFISTGLERRDLRPKALCRAFPDMLLWVDDASANGLGWITYASSSSSSSSFSSTSSSIVALSPRVEHAQGSGMGMGVFGALTSQLGQLALANGGQAALTMLGKKGGAQSVQLSMSKSTKSRGETHDINVKETVTMEITVSPYGAHAGRTKFDKSIKRDRFDNVVGPEYDLSPDNAFKGQRIVVIQLYNEESFTFAKPRAALERKGFAVDHFNHLPSVAMFTEALKKACQLWVISTNCQSFTVEYMPAIQKLVDLKKGLFLWGDNDPYNADVNFILAHLTQTNGLSLSGNYHGERVLTETEGEKGWERPGFYNGRNMNLVFTGIESIFEGITIATIKGPSSQYRSIMRASDGQVVTGVHDKNDVRILIDGGFTRLFESLWDKTAGTARFVTNAACWLYNFEGRSSGKKKYQAAAVAVKGVRTGVKSDGPKKGVIGSAGKTVCHFYMQGRCANGFTCGFLHPQKR